MRLISLLGLPGLMLGTAVAAADFVPGRAYYSFSSFENCYEGETEQIWEFDPATGASRRFATIPWPDCGGLSGLAFTPDGRGLRVSNYLRSSILEIDGYGNYRTIYDYDDGVSYPGGANNIVFDAAGNFYVGNAANGVLGDGIVRFPADGGPGELFSAFPMNNSAIVSLADGNLYLGPEGGGIYRIAPDGTVISWDAAITARAMTTDSLGNFYVLNATGLYRYRSASIREFLGPTPFFGTTISGTADPFTLLLTSDTTGVWTYSTITGQYSQIGTVYPGAGFFGPLGAAFYVPEPSAVLNLLILVGAALAARGHHRTSNKEQR